MRRSQDTPHYWLQDRREEIIKTEIISHISSSATAMPLPEPQVDPGEDGAAAPHAGVRAFQGSDSPQNNGCY